MTKKLFMFVLMVVLVACTRRETMIPLQIETTLILSFAADDPTRAAIPDENRVTDCNILAFNAFGDLEEKVYVPSRSMKPGQEFKIPLLRNASYTLLCALNLGYELPLMDLEQARSYRFHLAYPDAYREGLPMVGLEEEFIPGDTLRLQARRLMARIDLQLDRSDLPEDVFVKVTDVEVRHCPSSVTLFPGSCARETFYQGFTHHNTEVQPLNRYGADGISETLPLYILETMAEGSSVEIKAEYHSPDFHTDPGERVSYSFDLPPLERNCIYPVVASLQQKR